MLNENAAEIMLRNAWPKRDSQAYELQTEFGKWPQPHDSLNIALIAPDFVRFSYELTSSKHINRMGLLLAAERRLCTGPITFAPLRLSACSETETLDDG